jgi:hypothetical protein
MRLLKVEVEVELRLTHRRSRRNEYSSMASLQRSDRYRVTLYSLFDVSNTMEGSFAVLGQVFSLPVLTWVIRDKWYEIRERFVWPVEVSID